MSGAAISATQPSPMAWSASPSAMKGRLPKRSASAPAIGARYGHFRRFHTSGGSDSGGLAATARRDTLSRRPHIRRPGGRREQ